MNVEVSLLKCYLLCNGKFYFPSECVTTARFEASNIKF